MVWIGVEEDSVRPSERVHWSARVLVGFAVAVAVMVAAYLFIPRDWAAYGWGRFLIGGAVLSTLTPLPVRGRRPFEIVRRVAAGLLILLAVPGLYYSLYMFLPAAVILLLAPAAAGTQGWTPVAACVAGLLVFAACAVPAARYWLTRPDAFVVTLTPDFLAHADAMRVFDGSGQGIGFGATRVSSIDVESDRPPTVLVGFDDSLSAAGQQRLADHLLGIDGVVRVNRCYRWQQDCEGLA